MFTSKLELLFMISVRDVPLPLFKVKILNLVFRTYSCALLATHFPSPWTIVPSPTPIPPFLIATVICFREQASYTPTIHHFHFQLKTRMLFFLQNILSSFLRVALSFSFGFAFHVTVHVCFVVIIACNHCFLQSYYCCKCTHTCTHSSRMACCCSFWANVHPHTCMSIQRITHAYTPIKVYLQAYMHPRQLLAVHSSTVLFFFFYFLCNFFITSLLYVKWCTLHRGPCHPHRRATACTIAKNSHNYRFFSIRIFSPLPHCAPTPHSPTTFANALWWLLGILVQRW